MSKFIPLNQTCSGQKIRIANPAGKQELRRRLMAMGLGSGTELEISQSNKAGVVLARGGNRIALGSGMTDTLFAEVLN